MATVAQCAKHIDLKERRFREMIDQGIFKRRPRGDYDIDAITIIYVRRLRAEAAGRADNSATLTEQARDLRKPQLTSPNVRTAPVLARLSISTRWWR
jgi:hypothetical protein